MSGAGNFAPGRLWSLWDMLEFYAFRFVTAHHHLSALSGVAWHATISAGTGFGMPEAGWQEQRNHAVALIATLDELEVLGPKVSAERVLASLDAAQIGTVNNVSVRVFSQENAEKLKSLIIETSQRISDELGSTFLLSISPEKLPFFTGKKSAFGEVPAKFGSLAYEIEEAGKCYALDRGTACAFHSIRCLEAGIQAMARCLQIPDPTKGSQRSWANILRIVKDRMDARWPNQTDRFTGDGRLFEDFYASLSAMQNPWRNATMHLDQKYTDGEAKHLMDVIGGFMNRLASRMDESGLPLA